MGWFRRSPAPAPAPAPVPAPVPVVGVPAKIYGVATDTLAERTAFNTAAGKPVNVFSIYKSFFWDAAFPTAEVKQINTDGYTPMITWEPWEPNGNAVQPSYTLAQINLGKFDAIIKSWATSVKALGFPVLIRFAHEMNGDWYPWGNTNGNTSNEYVDAYIRVKQIFVAAGVTNVKWVWSPNVDFPVAPYWPGASNVDYIALDGYNWDTSSPEQVFGPTIDQLVILGKPIFIGETGCPEYSGKAKWITDFFAMVKNRGLVGFIWFNIKKEQDWRIQSSLAATNSFKTNVSSF